MATTRTSQASTPMPAVRSRHTLSLPSLWAPSPPCHTSPRSPLLPTVSPIPRLPSTPLSPPPPALRLPPQALVLAPPAPPAPRPPVGPALRTPAEVVALVLLPVSRSDPPFSPWVSVLLVLFLPSSLWPKLGQQIYRHSVVSLGMWLQIHGLLFSPFGYRTYRGNRGSSHSLSYAFSDFPSIIIFFSSHLGSFNMTVKGFYKYVISYSAIYAALLTVAVLSLPKLEPPGPSIATVTLPALSPHALLCRVLPLFFHKGFWDQDLYLG